MQRSQNQLAPYAARLTSLWERMVRAIGIHTANVLLERAIWESSERYPNLACLERTDQGLAYGALAEAYAGHPAAEAEEAINDLIAELSLILTRLLGKEMAQRFAQELEAAGSDGAAI